MRSFSLLFILTCLIIVPGFAQNKITEKLKTLYQEEAFEKIIDYKARKVKSFEAEALYYKAMAHYMTNDDRNAQIFFKKAIKKGPVSADMHYYYGKSQTYTKDYEDALYSFNKAISLKPQIPAFFEGKGRAFELLEQTDSATYYYELCTDFKNVNPRVYTSLGSIYYQEKKYDKALKNYRTALSLIESKGPQMQNCLYNIGLVQQQSGKYQESKETFENLLQLFPEDYHSTSKLIQAYYALDEIEKTADLKKKMIEAYRAGKMKDPYKQMYCFDQFLWKGSSVKVFESYEDYPDEVLIWKHKFLISGEKGNIHIKVQSNLDTLSGKNGIPKQYKLMLLKDDTLSTFDHFAFKPADDYKKLKQAVLQILNEEVIAQSKMGGYDQWMNKQLEMKLDDVGTSFKNAISIGSVADEYDWLRKNYPGYTFKQQSLIFEGGKPYDVLSITTTSGKKRKVYFDISSFFGKGF